MGGSVERQRRERGANSLRRREKASQSRRPGMESGCQGGRWGRTSTCKGPEPAYLRSDQFYCRLFSLAGTWEGAVGGGGGVQGKPEKWLELQKGMSLNLQATEGFSAMKCLPSKKANFGLMWKLK